MKILNPRLWTALILLALLLGAKLAHSSGVSAATLSITTSVADSTGILVRKASPDSVTRVYRWGRLRDTVNVLSRAHIHDTALILVSGYKQTASDSGKKIVHDSLIVRVPQAIDTAASPRWHSLTVGLNSTGSTTALLATSNCPCHTGTAPAAYLGILLPSGDTLWVPGWK